jgi:hypothetical protein
MLYEMAKLSILFKDMNPCRISVSLVAVMELWILKMLTPHPFSLEMRFVLPLAVVGLDYRHRALRQECIRTLTAMSRREAIWDASMMGRIMNFQAEIEEEGLGDDEEYVPEDGMLTIVYLKVDEPLRIVFITCALGIRGHPWESVMKQTELIW